MKAVAALAGEHAGDPRTVTPAAVSNVSYWETGRELVITISTAMQVEENERSGCLNEIKKKSHFLLCNSTQFSVKVIYPCIWDPGCSQISTLPLLMSAKMEENRKRGPL